MWRLWNLHTLLVGRENGVVNVEELWQHFIKSNLGIAIMSTNFTQRYLSKKIGNICIHKSFAGIVHRRNITEVRAAHLPISGWENKGDTQSCMWGVAWGTYSCIWDALCSEEGRKQWFMESVVHGHMMSLKRIMLNERNSICKATLDKAPHISCAQDCNSIQIESRLMVIRD